MLHSRAQLSEKVFDTDVSQKPIRDGYGEGLVLAGEKNQDVVALCADLTESTRTEAFSKKFPDRYFEMGVAEQNMATIASGLAAAGKVPFIASYATFSPGRNWEQIRTTISYNDADVKIAGHHAGISVGPDGATHQAVEDIATMRVMANMRVLVPCDAIEAKKVTVAAAETKGPVYMRFAREKSPVFTTEETPFAIGKAVVFWESENPQLVIIGCGALIHNALRAAKELHEEGVEAVVVNSPSVKPLDQETILSYAKKTGAVVTVEEHQIMGGLGGAISEFLAMNAPMPIEFIGMRNIFGESGSPNELIEKYGMGVGHIKAAARKVIGRKA